MNTVGEKCKYFKKITWMFSSCDECDLTDKKNRSSRLEQTRPIPDVANIRRQGINLYRTVIRYSIHFINN
jgi:hypothetical protein